MPSRKDLPTLTRAESELMKIVWERGPVTVHQVVEAMSRDVAYTTVLTILRIMEKKGYVRHDPDPAGGRAYLYSAAVEQEKVRRDHVRDLVQRMFSGNTVDLVAGLVDQEKLSRDELEALRDRIDARLGTTPAKKERKR